MEDDPGFKGTGTETIPATISGSFDDEDNFIDDEGRGSTLQDLTPEGVPPEERERIMHRLEVCAKAREESTRIMSFRFAQRDAVKEDLSRAADNYRRDLLPSKMSGSSGGFARRP